MAWAPERDRTGFEAGAQETYGPHWNADLNLGLILQVQQPDKQISSPSLKPWCRTRRGIYSHYLPTLCWHRKCAVHPCTPHHAPQEWHVPFSEVTSLLDQSESCLSHAFFTQCWDSRKLGICFMIVFSSSSSSSALPYSPFLPLLPFPFCFPSAPTSPSSPSSSIFPLAHLPSSLSWDRRFLER